MTFRNRSRCVGGQFARSEGTGDTRKTRDGGCAFRRRFGFIAEELFSKKSVRVGGIAVEAIKGVGGVGSGVVTEAGTLLR